MPVYQENYTANVQIEHQIINPATRELSWTPYETMTLCDTSIEQLTQRAYLYVGRPERREYVQAIRLTGTVTLMERAKQPYLDHYDSVALHLYMLRERK